MITIITATNGILEYVEGCKIIDFGETINSDHRGIIAEIHLEGFFHQYMDDIDQINHTILDCTRISHRNKFNELVEKRLDTIPIEQYIKDNDNDNPNKYQLEQID